jgi:hypothetical protein
MACPPDFPRGVEDGFDWSGLFMIARRCLGKSGDSNLSSLAQPFEQYVRQTELTLEPSPGRQ